MNVFCHHVYEYRKGLRNLVLHTLPGRHRADLEAKLAAKGIDYVIHELGNGNINVFFGADACVDVVRAIGKTDLSVYTPEEDFILGTMLGYGRLQQCDRYIRRRQGEAGRAAAPRGSRSGDPAGETVSPAMAV